MEENLNINYHVSQLVVKALNRYPTKKRAAEALGVTEKSVYRYIAMYCIERAWEQGKRVYSQKQSLTKKIMHHA